MKHRGCVGGQCSNAVHIIGTGFNSLSTHQALRRHSQNTSSAIKTAHALSTSPAPGEVWEDWDFLTRRVADRLSDPHGEHAVEFYSINTKADPAVRALMQYIIFTGGFGSFFM